MKGKETNITAPHLTDNEAKHCVSVSTGRLFAAYVAGLLADNQEEAFEEHLLSCPLCREKFLALGSLAASR